ncbi:MAG: GNAT family N-acetyltransferase, partial [Thermomicrobiaceae bacterium]|nr:GNAT family N-acetyltransferase [Thermomicrobiaceae bacterium]
MAVESERSVRSGTFILEPMEIEDVPEVSRLEHRCFTNPWPESAYRRELRNPEHNYYIVLRHQRDGAPAASDDATSRGVLGLLPLLRSRPERTATEPIVGFAGMWTLYDEAHVTTIASAPEYRGLGLGELLLANLFDAAIARNANWLTLAVRVSNI